MDGPKGGAKPPPPPRKEKQKKKKFGPPQPKGKKNLFNGYIYIYISRVVPHSSKNLDSLSFN